MKTKEIFRMIIISIIAAILMGVSVDVFVVNANFAPGGVTGLSVIANYLFKVPIGLAIVLFNIPIILCTFKKLGKKFFINSLISIIICSLFIDYVIIHVPAFTGNRVVATILAGVCAGIGYAILFNENSSTGGTDFIIVALKKWKKHLSFGFFAFIIDGIIIVLSVFVFKEIDVFLYGVLYTLVTSVFMDLSTKLIRRFQVNNIENKIIRTRE